MGSLSPPQSPGSARLSPSPPQSWRAELGGSLWGRRGALSLT